MAVKRQMPADAMKLKRSSWWSAFWKYLDAHPELGATVRKWQSAGCDPRDIAVTMHLFVSQDTWILDQRRSRRKLAEKTLRTAAEALAELAEFYRGQKLATDADRVQREADLTMYRLSRVPEAYGTKRLGYAQNWLALATIEGLVFEKSQTRPTPTELSRLVFAARAANGQSISTFDTVELIGKGLRKFKRDNPNLALAWTSPSSIPPDRGKQT